MPGRGAILVPAAQDILDCGIGGWRVVRAMGAVHGDDIGNDAAGIAGKVRGDAQAPGTFNQEGGMADKGKLHLVFRQGGRDKLCELHAGGAFSNGEAITRQGLGISGQGKLGNRKTERGKKPERHSRLS